MGNRQNCAKFQENLFRSNEIVSIFCPPLFRKRPITIYTSRKKNSLHAHLLCKVATCLIYFFLYIQGKQLYN